MMSFGKMATPPHPIGSFQPTKVRPFTEAGEAMPAHHNAKPLASTPVRSRSTPSVTRAVTLRIFMRAHKMSPKMPAVSIPMASATAITPSGIASIAPRVEIGRAQLSGVAKSSRAGTNRNVKAGPISRSPPKTSGFGPFIQQRLMPFLSSMVVMVAVVTLRRTSNAAELIAYLVEIFGLGRPYTAIARQSHAQAHAGAPGGRIRHPPLEDPSRGSPGEVFP